MALDLNEKPWYWAAAIGVALGLALFLALNSYVFKKVRQDIVRLQNENQKLEREVEKGRAAQRDLPKLEEEIQNLKLELSRLRRILPTKRETDDLIKRLKQLTERGRFRLIRFTPGEFVDRDFIWEWPITVELDGTYHQLGLLFDRLSRFSRIINVDSLEVRPFQAKGEVYSVHASFTQKTFIYKEMEESQGGAP